MKLFIEASNIRSGGGLSHLKAELEVVEAPLYGFDSVTITAPSSTLDVITDRPWLIKKSSPFLDGGLTRRLYWQRMVLPRLLASTDLLFVPGGIYSGGFRPFVTMARNLQPFDSEVLERYGVSWTRLRLNLVTHFQSNTFRSAAGVIYLTEASKKIIEKCLPEYGARTIVIPHGADLRFTAEPRLQRPLSEYDTNNPFRLLYVSIVNVYKHQWYVAQAVAKLRLEGLPVTLDLVGPAHPIALKQLNNTLATIPDTTSFIHYHGAVPHNQLSKYYKEADAFVFASSCETFGIILLEAMTSGLPIACSHHQPLQETLGDGGVYFNPEEPESIASILRAFISDRDARERSALIAHQRALKQTWARSADQTFQFLRDIVVQN